MTVSLRLLKQPARKLPAEQYGRGEISSRRRPGRLLLRFQRIGSFPDAIRITHGDVIEWQRICS
jgi:hypothetical protein